MESLPRHPAKWLLIAFAVIALLGFGDATYLTAEHLGGVVPPCTIVHGCEQVLTSKYATVAGIPVSAAGMVYYAALIVLMLAYFDTRSPHLLRWARYLTWIGFAASLYFVSIQAFVLHAFCLYCMSSAIKSTILFFIGFLF